MNKLTTARGTKVQQALSSVLEKNETSGVLNPGRNCWRIEHADRVSFLIDGDAYFRAVRAAIAHAQHSVFILSWDIDSRMRLAPNGAHDGLPELLGDFLQALITKRKGLHVHLLNWDFAMLYALEREWLPVYKLGWRTHRRLHFRMDGRHPIGASHHQKVVVVDDKVAFVGGLDLTRCRWDTPQHKPDEPLRCDADGTPHSAFHDVQAMVDGAAARALGELVRDRWFRATGRHVDFCKDDAADPWPQLVQPDIVDVDVAIVRTDPKFEDRPAIEEIRQLHIDAIESAQRFIYFENQYFTSGIIAQALSARLNEETGPEIVVVSRLTESGWLEEATMGVLRARLHERLKAVNTHGHYRMYYPVVPGLETKPLNVHSKLMVVDDELLCVGSANLSNRSMVLDTECNIAIEARGDPRIREAIARFRNRLLAEHLNRTPETVSAVVDEKQSLLTAIESLRGPGRSLDILDPVVTPELDALVPVTELIDPEQPIDPDELVDQLMPKEARKPVPSRIAGLAVLTIALGLLAITWRWTPLREWLNLKALIRLAETLNDLPFTPIAVVSAYVVSGFMMIPVTILIAVTGIVFGPVLGSCYAFAGTLLSAFISYMVGQWLGHDWVRRLAGTRINRLSRRIASRGIFAVAVVRMLPIAPFTVINVVAGASHIGLRDFLVGTLIGLSPGILLTVTFVHHLIEAMRTPNAIAFAVLAVVAGMLIGIAIVSRRYLRRKEES